MWEYFIVNIVYRSDKITVTINKVYHAFILLNYIFVMRPHIDQGSGSNVAILHNYIGTLDIGIHPAVPTVME